MKTRSLMAVLALSLAGPAMAATCSSTANWGSIATTGVKDFGASFSSKGSYLDCYSFSLSAMANSFGGVTEYDPWWSSLDIDVSTVSLFAGGILSGHTTGSLLDTDSASNFSFGALSAGTYTLAVATTVSKDFGIYPSVSYDGTIQTSAVSVASPAPEPESYAMMLAGLAGVGFAARRRKQG